jgi:tRNA (cmo5U34)-methyltransferase
MTDIVQRQDHVWKGAALVRAYLDGVRGGVPFAAEQIDVMLRVIAARTRAVEAFADLGCGDGVLAGALLAQYPHAAATLIDFSEPMLAAARRRCGAAVNVRFVLADFGVQEWRKAIAPAACFDVIVSGYAIHHQPDVRKRQLYAELLALLSPGGLFINVEHVASRSPWIEAIADELMIDSLHAFHQREGSGKSRAQVADEFVHRPDKAANILAPVEVQCEWLRQCGFRDVDCYFKAFELAVFGGRK